MNRVALLLITAAACGGHRDDGGATGSAAPTAGGGSALVANVPDGLDLRLSNGKAGKPATDRSQLAPAKKLGDADANAMFARAKPIDADPSDKAAFAMRPASAPPPVTGTTVAGAFPPPAASLLKPPPDAAPSTGELEVLRYMPEGQVPIAPELSVTFSQPMVAVTSQTDAAATTPVKLTPQPKGKWRWIGTRTILFDPEIRFPQATTYTVEVPAGVHAAGGAALGAPTKFTFETPPPTVVSSYPSLSEPQRLDAPMFLLFDQKVDAAAVLAHVKLEAGGKTFGVRALTTAEITGDKTLTALTTAAHTNEQDGRWVAFRPAQALPGDSAVNVLIAAGTPSAEGPNATKEQQTFTFRTYPPFAFTTGNCGGSTCRPGEGFVLRFNNTIDADKFKPEQIAITPAIPGAQVSAQGNFIYVQGATAPRTTYKVAIPASLADAFGQTLGSPRTHDVAVGDPDPTFFGPSGTVVLDPVAKSPALDFFTLGYPKLKVKLYKVAPTDYDAYTNAVRNLWNKDHPVPFPGTVVFDKVIDAAAATGPSGLAETAIDLSPALTGTFGHAIAIVEPSPWKESYDPPRLISWVQSTQLAVDAHVDGDNLLAFATDLATGAPLSGIAVELRPFGITGTTDAQGLATLALAAPGPAGGHYLLARRGDDVAFVTDQQSYYSASGSWSKRGPNRSVAWYVVDDRHLYKPGEEVSLKGWLRTLDYGKSGDVNPIEGVSAVSYAVMDSQGNRIATGTAPVSGLGGFDTKFTLPKTPNLGYAMITFSTVGASSASYTTSIQVEEFRRPEFEVSAHASQGPFLVGDGSDVTVDAKYYSGGPLPGAETRWTVSASQTTYTPPNRDDYTFGAFVPWWGGGDIAFDEGPMYYRGGSYKPPKTWTLAGKTDATGAHVLHMDFLSAKPSVPMSVSATASVTDVNRQQWTSSAALIVHPASLYVGLKASKWFVESGEPYALQVIGVDLDGKAVPGAKIDVRATRMEWQNKNGRYAKVAVEPQTCAVVAAADAVPCTFQTKTGGEYEVTATIVDAKGRANQTTQSFWASGGERPPAREVQQEVVQIVPDKKEYAGGDTAALLVQSPFFPAEGLVTWRRSGIVKTERITLKGPTAVVKVPIADAMVPNLTVQVDLVGAAARTDDKGAPDPKLPKRPAYAVGAISLSIPPKQRALAVTVAPAAAKVSPGEKTSVSVAVVDAAGKPVVGSEVAVIVVDESILALGGATFADPLGAFYVARGPDTEDAYERAYVKLAKPVAEGFGAGNGAPADGFAGPMGGEGGGAHMALADESAPAAMAGSGSAPGAPPPPPPPAPPGMLEQKPTTPVMRSSVARRGGAPAPAPAFAVRSNFNPLAAFAPAVKTDAAGKATVSVTVPDNLTRYRIVALAVAGAKQFGKGESALTARLPLMVRPSPPRFLNFGDTFQLPVVVQNQTDSPMTVRVAVRATNASITDGAGREVTVPANDRVEVQFPAAAELAGTARFQILGAAGASSDAAEVALPVWTPATTEAFATYGVVDEGATKQQVALPEAVVPQFGGLEVTTASTNLGSLTDALLYLVHYPFDCAEQRSSRILSIAALKDVLSAFRSKDLPSEAAMAASVASDIEHLSQMQNGDGGFAYWERGRPSEPYLTVYVASALHMAAVKGFVVDRSVIERVKPYLRDIENYYSEHYSDPMKASVSAFALYTRKQLGDPDVAKAKALVSSAGDRLPTEAIGWLMATLAQDSSAVAERKTLLRLALNKVSETAGAANFSTGYADGAYLILASDHRADAVMLDALIQEEPGNDLIPKVVTGLLGAKKAGRWLNTQENTFALVALDRYFHTYEKATPNFVSRIWLGADYAGDHAFRGRTTEQFQIAIPMSYVATHDKSDLTIAKDGPGRLYYRIGMTYAPASLTLAPADYGFVVERTYEGLDDQSDVQRQPDGSWKIKAGSRVRVKLSLVNENIRYHVALVDPLPAGLEAMNPSLATTGPLPTSPADQRARGRYWWWYGPWYEHQNLRDERVEAFTTELYEGVHSYSYVARATTPGHFIVPPPKAEEMYMPETFGRGGTDRVVVE